MKFKSKTEGFEITTSNDLVLRMEEETGRKACAGVQSYSDLSLEVGRRKEPLRLFILPIKFLSNPQGCNNDERYCFRVV